MIEGRTNHAKKHDSTVNRLILITATLCGLMLIGMLFNIWQLVFFSTPLLIVVFLLLGSTGRSGKIHAGRSVIITYGVFIVALFVAMGILEGSQTYWFGLPISSGILMYVVWPFTTITSGILYAYVYQVSLSKDVQSD